MKTYNVADGVDIRLIKSDKFKTNLITLYMAFDISREKITKVSVLSQVLTRGTMKYKTLTEISKREEELYGATVRCGIKRKGANQVLAVSIEFPSDKFLNENINKDVIELLKEVVFCPFAENDAFDADYVRQEKENVKNYIASIINDKRTYSKIKCLEYMYDGEPEGISEYGYIEDLSEINEKNLYEFYRQIIANAKIDVFVSGNFVEEEIVEDVKSGLLANVMPRTGVFNKSGILKRGAADKIVEEMDVSQSKLCIGFTTEIGRNDKDFYALSLCNCIFGGSPFSKLFNNVREKLSLAYYVSSSYISTKGVMLLSSGIETENYDKAYDEIMVQLNKLKNGEIEENEITSAIKYIKTGFNSVKDSLRGIENYIYSGLVIGDFESIDEHLEKIEKVTKDDIIRAANKIEVDTIYFLKGVSLDKESE